MDLFDFFFPEQAQASHLRKIANNRRQTKPVNAGTDKIDSLQRDVNFLALVLTSVLKRLDETKTLSLGDVQDILNDVDTMDGIADNGLDPKMLRGLLGALDRKLVKTHRTKMTSLRLKLHRDTDDKRHSLLG